MHQVSVLRDELHESHASLHERLAPPPKAQAPPPPQPPGVHATPLPPSRTHEPSASLLEAHDSLTRDSRTRAPSASLLEVCDVYDAAEETQQAESGHLGSTSGAKYRRRRRSKAPAPEDALELQERESASGRVLEMAGRVSHSTASASEEPSRAERCVKSGTPLMETLDVTVEVSRPPLERRASSGASSAVADEATLYL